MNREELHRRVDNDFTYHAPHGNQVERYTKLREAARQFGHLIVDETPISREQSLALTFLQECSMMSNKAIACNESPADGEEPLILYCFLYERLMDDGNWHPGDQLIKAQDVGQAFSSLGFIVQTMNLTIRNIRYGLMSEMAEELEKVHEHWRNYRLREQHGAQLPVHGEDLP